MDMKQLTNKVWHDPIYFLAFGFGSGLMPIAPGTWGTLAAVPIYLLIAGMGTGLYFMITLLAFLMGIYICQRVTRDIQIHDFSGIVWDEVVGYLLTMFLAPFELSWMVIGFILFRLFDIWKPYPIKWVDMHVQGGLGIMLDDVLAAIPAWIIMQLLILSFTR